MTGFTRAALRARPRRAGREHQDLRRGEGGAQRPRRPPGSPSARCVRHASPPTGPGSASPVPGRSRPADLDDNGVLSIGLKLMGVRRAEAARRRGADPGLHRDQLADVHHPQRRREPEAPAPGVRRYAGAVLRRPLRLALPRRHHAGPLRAHAHQPARGPVLQLRAVPARRGPGRAVLDQAHRPGPRRGSRGTPPTTTCARRWWNGSGPATCTSTSWCRCRRTLAACRSRTPRWSGPRSCRRS